MATVPASLQMSERVSLSRPARLGTRRQTTRPRVGALALGVSRGVAAPSLDTSKVLIETSVRDWARQQETPQEIRREKWALHGQLLSSLHTLWQDYSAAGDTANATKFEKQWLQVHNCQSEWLGYRADCCK